MAANRQLSTASRITDVHVCQAGHGFEQGILVTFGKGTTVFFDADWLFDHREVCGNFTLDEQDASA